MLPREVESNSKEAREASGYLAIMYRIAHTWNERKAYFKNIVKRSKLLDEMAAKARAEVLRIEAARLDAHRLLLRRKAELCNLVPKGKRKSLITQ